MARQYDIENERAIVASCLVSQSVLSRVVGAAKVEDFQGERFKTIFSALMLCEQQNLVPDNEAIAVQAGGDDYGGYEFLNRLRTLEPVVNLEFHLDRLRKESARSRAVRMLSGLEDTLTDRTKDHGECLRKAADLVAELRVSKITREDAARDYINDLDRRCSGETPFVSTGYPSLDSILREGFGRGLISVIAGRPGNGKSTLVVDCVRRLLEGDRKPRILVIPLEIGRTRFLDKLASSATLISSDMLRKHPEELTLAERDEIKRVMKKMISTDDRLTVMDNSEFFETRRDKWDNEAACDRMESILAEGDFQVVLSDLWQRILTDTRPGPTEMALIRHQRFGQKYQVHQVFIHQISRKSEERRGKQPELLDLKGSGGYEEIPDQIFLVHRAKAYKQFMKKDIIEVRLAKQRDGIAGRTMLAEFLPSVSRLENDHLAGEEEMERAEKKKNNESETVF